MNDLVPRERLLRVLRRQPVDRPPVICPGGMMNAAVVDVMRSSSVALPDAYADSDQLARLAGEVALRTGFENFALPFCMTLEAELLGSQINPGTIECEAKIAKEAFSSVSVAEVPTLQHFPQNSRAWRVIEAMAKTASKQPDKPIIGSLTGPISTVASIVDPVTFLKELRKDKPGAHRVLSQVTDVLVAFARLLIAAGADVIAVSDPTATGDILGPRAFEEFALRYLNTLTEAVHRVDRPVIVHICGDVGPVEAQVVRLRANALSTDSLVNLAKLKARHPELVTMGNLSTYLLQFGTTESVASKAEQLVADGIDIISPACGLSTTTGLENIIAMTDAVKGKRS